MKESNLRTLMVLIMGVCQKTHKERLNLFCRRVIPFIKNRPELQPLVMTWRKKYEATSLEGISLQKEALQECEQVFKEIAQSGGESELIKRKIVEIEEILSGDRTKVGYSSWPLYWEVHHRIKELLEILLAQGKTEICSKHAILKTTSNFDKVGTAQKPGTKLYILKFTFAPAVQKAADHEKIVDPENVQEAFVVWEYFETVLYLWNIKKSDIEHELSTQSDPLKALSTIEAWKEIALARYPGSDSKKEPRIFNENLFKNGLRTLVNEIRIFLWQSADDKRKP